MNPNVQQVDETIAAGHPDSEEAKVVALLKTGKHVSLPFRLIDEFGIIGCSEENGHKLLEYFRKAFPASTVTQAILTAPYIIVLCTKIPPGPLPFTVGGLPTIFTTEDSWDLRYKLGTPAQKRKHIVTSLNLRTKDKVTDEAIRTIAEELQQLHLRPTEIGFMSGFCRLAFPHSVDLTEIPYRIAGCAVYVQFHSVTTDTHTDTNDYLASTDSTLRPGVMFSSSIHSNGIQYLSTTSGLLVKDAEAHHSVTCALQGFLSDGIVFHPDPIRGRPIGEVVQRFPSVDVGLVRLEPGIRYPNEFFESEEGGASGVTPRCFATSQIGYTVEMDNPFNGSCAGSVIGTNYIFENNTYHQHNWQIFEHGTKANDGSCGSPILNENGEVAAILRFVDRENPKCGFAVMGEQVEKLGLELVDNHVF
jgi:hypothetical protein